MYKTQFVHSVQNCSKYETLKKAANPKQYPHSRPFLHETARPW